MSLAAKKAFTRISTLMGESVTLKHETSKTYDGYGDETPVYSESNVKGAIEPIDEDTAETTTGGKTTGMYSVYLPGTTTISTGDVIEVNSQEYKVEEVLEGVADNITAYKQAVVKRIS